MGTEKRFPEETDVDSNSSREKRIRRLPSFATTGRDFMSSTGANSHNMLLLRSIEPTLRRVIKEEVEVFLAPMLKRTGSLPRSPRILIERLQSPPTLQLTFVKELSLPIFTFTKIKDEDNNPLQITIRDISGRREFPKLIKVELVVVDVDFFGDEGESGDWSFEEFERKIIKERKGKRPLLIGHDVSVLLRDGHATSADVKFTDNSSWTRSRRFRLAARVAGGSCQDFRIREAISQPFMVKDNRVEGNRKNYPPSLDDEVWRLEKIGRDGSFHVKLDSGGIKTVQDLLKLNSAYPQNLKKILGTEMSDKRLKSVVSHAKTCSLNNKCYVLRKRESVVVFDSICQPVLVILDGIRLLPHNLVGRPHKVLVERSVREAYDRWNELEVVDREDIQLGDEESSRVIPRDQQGFVLAQNNNQDFGFFDAGAAESLPENELMSFSEWSEQLPAYLSPINDVEVGSISPVNDTALGSISSQDFLDL